MAKSRKQREKDAQMFANGVGLVAILVGAVVWFKTKSIYSGVVTLFLLLGLVLMVLWFQRNSRRAKTVGRTTVEDLNDGTWEEFEAYLVALFHTKGYKAELTPNGADFGADLVLERKGVRTVVQAKHWKTRDVNVKAIQEIVAAKGHYQATKAMVVITGFFTQQAIDLARSNKVELWDRDRLAKEMATSKLPKADEMPSEAAAGTGPVVATAPATPSEVRPQPQSRPEPWLNAEAPTVACPKCGAAMVRRTGKYGDFWGCSNFPRCHGTRQLAESEG